MSNNKPILVSHETMDSLVGAAQKYDLDHRPKGVWTRVSDKQVRNLIVGAIYELAEIISPIGSE